MVSFSLINIPYDTIFSKTHVTDKVIRYLMITVNRKSESRFICFLRFVNLDLSLEGRNFMPLAYHLSLNMNNLYSIEKIRIPKMMHCIEIV